jgi:hypothetical protein
MNNSNAARKFTSYNDFRAALGAQYFDEIRAAAPAGFGLMSDERAVQFPYILITPFGDWVRYDCPVSALYGAYAGSGEEMSGAAVDAIAFWTDFVEMDDADHESNERALVDAGVITR